MAHPAAALAEDEVDVEVVPHAFKCSVCLDVLIDPLLQSCGHSICPECRDLLRSAVCPECRQRCTMYTPNLIVKQHVWATYPKACRKKLEKLNGGWTIVEKAAGCTASLKRKLIDYVDKQYRNHKRVAYPPPPGSGLSVEWNGFISARLREPPGTTGATTGPPASTGPATTAAAASPLEIRLPGPAAHVFKLAMVKDGELFLAFGPPLGRSAASSRTNNVLDSDDDDV